MPFVSTAVAGFVTTLGASAAIATTVGTVTANLLTSVALSALSHALQPRQTIPPVGIQQNVTLGGVTPESFILGKYATAGHMVSPPYVHGTSGGAPNAYLTLIIELGGIPGQTLDGIIVAGEEITITSTVHPDYGNQLGGKYAGYAWVKYYDGTQTAADPYLVAKYSADPDRPWASTAIGTGICYAIVTLLFDRNLFNSIPSLQFIVGGVPLYDPRLDSSVGGSGAQRWSDSSTWAQTINPVVMAYNIARGVTLPDGNVWGGRYDAVGLPFDNWVAAMNACDTLVTNADSSTEPAYRAGYQVTVDQKPKDVIDELMKACAGQVAPMGDTLKVRAGGPGLPVYFFTDDDLIITDSQQLQPFPGLSATHNAVTATYPEPTALWATHDAPPRYNATWEAADQGRRLIAALQFPAVPYDNQVQRLMAAYITDERRFRRHTITLPPDAAAIEPLDVVSWTSAANGYSSKSFDVSQTVDQQMTVLQTLSLREVDPTDYSWDASTQQLPSAVTAAPAITEVAAQGISGFSVAATTVSDSGGTARISGLLISWTSVNAIDVQSIKVEIRRQSDQALVNVVNCSPALTGFIATQGIVAGITYEARATVEPFSGRPTTPTAWTAQVAPSVTVTPSTNEVTTDTIAPNAATQDGAIDASVSFTSADPDPYEVASVTIGSIGGRPLLISVKGSLSFYQDPVPAVSNQSYIGLLVQIFQGATKIYESMVYSFSQSTSTQTWIFPPISIFGTSDAGSSSVSVKLRHYNGQNINYTFTGSLSLLEVKR